MKLFLPIILLGISRSVFGKVIQREKSSNDYKLSYQELRSMNISCYPSDSCLEARAEDPPVPENGVKCSCHRQCWKYGTCCIDSPYSGKPPIQECVNTIYGFYYMVHRCPDNTHPDSIWRNHCESELNGTDDILKITPVTSLNTSKTYKNYYCFRCHESTTEYVSWDLEVTSDNILPEGTTIHSVAFDKTLKTWVGITILDESRVSVPVRMGFLFPDNVQAKPMACNTFNFKAGCPFGTDERLKTKCLSYSAVVYRENISYKNVHCALCNGASLAELTCDAKGGWGGGGGRGGRGRRGMQGWHGHRVGALGFECKFSADVKCFEERAESETCKGDYEIWNPVLKACVELTCADPTLVRKGDQCIAPEF